ncbi:hypothetical protein I7I51_00308 [Histoplasma capsulatum]|uniref:Uncharacterized protein n=1 Tax=Ajellomyces capsulatus TaxID=5037 RepID=A0A8A1MB83_AJECA|nr:hypothetical protein I7I51_00308 [Histoplasma capsulatum]
MALFPTAMRLEEEAGHRRNAESHQANQAQSGKEQTTHFQRNPIDVSGGIEGASSHDIKDIRYNAHTKRLRSNLGEVSESQITDQPGLTQFGNFGTTLRTIRHLVDIMPLLLLQCIALNIAFVTTARLALDSLLVFFAG